MDQGMASRDRQRLGQGHTGSRTQVSNLSQQGLRDGASATSCPKNNMSQTEGRLQTDGGPTWASGEWTLVAVLYCLTHTGSSEDADGHREQHCKQKEQPGQKQEGALA